MRGILEGIRSFSDELGRRHVYRACVYYLGVAWATISVADVLVDVSGLPSWVLTVLVLLTITGFPMVLVLAWIYEVSSGGLHRDDATASAPPALRTLFGVTVVLLSLGMAGTSWWLWLAPTPAPAVEPEAAAVPDPLEIAVLYFDDHSPDGSLAFLADGLTEGLIHELTGVEALRVTSRNGVKPFRDRNVPLDSLVRALGVGSVVEGSVVAAGDTILVSVQLVDASTGDQLANEQVRARMTDLIDLQRSVIREVARVLREQLGREVRLREHRAGATSSEAWALVRRAGRIMEEDFRFLLNRDERGLRRTLDRVDSLLAEAARIDPEWNEPLLARARVAEHRARLEMSGAGALDPAASAGALDLAAAAAATDSADGRPWALMGRIRRDLAITASADSAAALRARAESDFRTALDRSPDLAEGWGDLSDLLIQQGRYAEAQRAARRALAMDAFLESAPEVANNLFNSSLNLKEFAEAGRWCQEGRIRFTTDYRFALCGLLLMVSDPSIPPDVDRAWALVDSVEERLNPSSRPAYRTYGALQVAKVAARADLPDSARSILRARGGEPVPGWLAYDAAHLHLLLGDPREEVFGLLARYLDASPSMRSTVAEDWWFESLRGDPRFTALVER